MIPKNLKANSPFGGKCSDQKAFRRDLSCASQGDLFGPNLLAAVAGFPWTGIGKGCRKFGSRSALVTLGKLSTVGLGYCHAGDQQQDGREDRGRVD